jgi:hypothetical protein
MNRLPTWLPKTWKDRDTGRSYQLRHAWAYQTPANGEAGPVGFVARFEDAGSKVVIPFFKPGKRHGQFNAGAPAEPRPLFGLETLALSSGSKTPTLFIVEGEKDASALHRLGHAAVSVQGGSKAVGKADWSPILNPPGGSPPRLMIWPDQDEPGRAYAAEIWERIEAADASDRARVLIEPPAGTPQIEGAGAADWLQAALLASGQEWDGMRPLPDGVQAEQIKDLRHRLADAMQKRVGKLPEAWRPVPPKGEQAANRHKRHRPSYIDTHRGTFRMRYTNEGPIEEQLCNFKARILEEAERDDGRERTRQLTLNGELDQRPLPAISVTVEEFQAMKWPMKYWGTACMIFPERSAAEHLRTAIQEISHQDGEVQQRTLYTHTGWRQIHGQWAYLSAGGAIGPEGLLPGIETDLGELTSYALPAPSQNHQERLQAAMASRRAAQVAPSTVSVVMLGAMFLAPLAEELRPDLMVWLEGPSRTRKSSYAALMLAHFGAEMERTRLPANWHDTANNLEYKSFILKDAPLIVDDYAPVATAKAKAAMDAAAEKLIRAIGNRSSRGRQQADMTQRRGYPPRGMVLATGEQYPETESIVARLFGVSLRPGDIDLAKLTSSQQDATKGLLARCMADHLQAMAMAYPAHLRAARQRWSHYRATAMAQGMDGRLQEQVAYLMVGYEAAVNHWRSAGAITETDQTQHLAEGWNLLCDLAKAHDARIKSEQPAETFLYTLRELLFTGAVHVRDKESDGSPTQAGPLSWRGAFGSGELVGWHSAKDMAFYLMPGTTLGLVNDALNRTGQKIHLRPSDLWRQCEHRGFIRQGGASSPSDGNKRKGCKVRINGKPMRVLIFDDKAILDST